MLERGSFRGKTIVLAGGGSGGHITPLVAVGHRLKELGADLVLMGDFGDGQFDPLTKELEVPRIAIPAGKLRRYWSLANFSSPWRFGRGWLAAAQHLMRLKPQGVFAKGGYASFPVVLAAYQLGIPIVTHESDVRMGLANQWASRLAKRVCVNLPINKYPARWQKKLVQTGMPIAERFFHLPPARPQGQLTILVTGGSQGSETINRAVAETFGAESDYQIFHIVGPNNRQRYQFLASSHYQIFGLVSPTEFSQLLGRAEIVISRASATTMAEIAAAGRPAILVPLPEPAAANNHQEANARIWAETGAVRVIFQKDLTAAHLRDVVKEVAEFKVWQRMAKAAKRMSVPDATERVIQVIKEVSR